MARRRPYENQPVTLGGTPGLEALGAAIRRARAESSQEDLGIRLGVPQTTISRWERGTVDLGVETIRALEEALGLARGELLIAGGFVADVPEGEGREIRRRMGCSAEEAAALLHAADKLRLGVRITNRAVPSGDGVRDEWTVSLRDRLPGDH